jgi:hypothetical protein
VTTPTTQEILDFARTKRIAPPHLAIIMGLVLAALWAFDAWPTDALGFRFSGMWISGLLMGWSLCRWWHLRLVHRAVVADLEKAVGS